MPGRGFESLPESLSYALQRFIWLGWCRSEDKTKVLDHADFSVP